MNKLTVFFSTLIFSSIFLLIIYFHTHGFIPYDEGWFLQAGKRILNGERIYRDFEFLYNPGSAYLNALAFKMFGESVLSSRIFAIVNSVISIFTIFYISKKIKIGGILSIILMLSFVFWGAGHINFIWPVMICLTLGFLSGALFLNIGKSKFSTRLVVLAGMTSALVFIFKQNFGLAIILTNFLFLLLNKQLKNIKLVSCYIFGFMFVILVQVLYFLNVGILDDYINDIYFYTVEKIYKEGILSSSLPWDYPAHPLIQFFKFLLYISPLLISFLTISRLIKTKNKQLMYFPLISILFYALSIRPTTDFVHLTPLFAFSVINIGIIYKSLKKSLGKRIFFLIIILFCAIGAYSSLFRNYYRWNSPLVNQNIFSNNEKVGIWVDSKENENISKISEYFNKSTIEEYLFIYNFSPAYYVILNKKNPTQFDYLHTGVMSVSDENKIINTLEEKKLKNILTNIDIGENQSKVTKFILNNYRNAREINEYTIWEKR